MWCSVKVAHKVCFTRCSVAFSGRLGSSYSAVVGIFNFLATDAVSVVWCVCRRVLCHTLDSQALFFFFASERFGRSLRNRTHKNEMEYRRELSIHFFMRDCWNGFVTQRGLSRRVTRTRREDDVSVRIILVLLATVRPIEQ